MQQSIPLSYLLTNIQDSIEADFGGGTFWVSCRIMNVKKYESNRRCYLSVEEVENGNKIAEIKAVFWSSSYSEIEKFEALTKQPFSNGTEIVCRVKVRFHVVYGLNLDILQLDVAHTLGALELERQSTLHNLIQANPNTVKLVDEEYFTFNKSIPLPIVIKNIALITAPNSDGQRDFVKELTENIHLFTFKIEQYVTTIQGDTAHENIIEQLKKIKDSKQQYDLVAIVRGGGALGDFKPFETFALANEVINFPIPIFTGIGHDRNQSIVDMMARSFKTPTKVANYIVANNFDFENRLLRLKEQLKQLVAAQLSQAKENILSAKKIIKMASPEHILNRGFAIVKKDGKVLVDDKQLKKNDKFELFFGKTIIESEVVNKKSYEKEIEL